MAQAEGRRVRFPHLGPRLNRRQELVEGSLLITASCPLCRWELGGLGSEGHVPRQCQASLVARRPAFFSSLFPWRLSWTASSPAHPLLPSSPFFCRVSSPLTTSHCWLNHPGLAWPFPPACRRTDQQSELAAGSDTSHRKLQKVSLRTPSPSSALRVGPGPVQEGLTRSLEQEGASPRSSP